MTATAADLAAIFIGAFMMERDGFGECMPVECTSLW
jgi:hypothetical protein